MDKELSWNKKLESFRPSNACIHQLTTHILSGNIWRVITFVGKEVRRGFVPFKVF